MRQLDAGAGALTVDKSRDPLERLEMLFAPDAEVLRRNAPLRGDRGGLGEHEPRAADRARAEMGEVPVVGIAVDGKNIGTSAKRRCDW